jgi:hypothetical protein
MVEQEEMTRRIEAGGFDEVHLPDVRVLPPWAIEIWHEEDRQLLAFGTTAWNAGPGSLVIEGYRTTNPEVTQAFQLILGKKFTRRIEMSGGALYFDDRPGHGHWHFSPFAEYALVSESGQIVGQIRKQSFCLASNLLVSAKHAIADPSPDFRDPSRLRDCMATNSRRIHQELFPGWGESYFPSVDGQSLDITHVPNGRYLLVAHVNAGVDILETATENNVAFQVVILQGDGGNRTVVAPGGIPPPVRVRGFPAAVE